MTTIRYVRLALLAIALLLGLATAQRQSTGTSLVIEGVSIMGLTGTVTDVVYDDQTLVLSVQTDDGRTQTVQISPWVLNDGFDANALATEDGTLSLHASFRPFFDGAITKVQVSRNDTVLAYAVSSERIPSDLSAPLQVSRAFGSESDAAQRGVITDDGRRLALGQHELAPPWCLDLLSIAFPTPPPPGIAQEAEGPRFDYLLYRCNDAP